MPPFGHKTHLRVFIDSDLLPYGPVDEQACGLLRGHDVFGIEPYELVEASAGVVTDLKRK